MYVYSYVYFSVLYVCMYVCMTKSICVFIMYDMYVYLFLYMYVYMNVCMTEYLCVFIVYVCMYVCSLAKYVFAYTIPHIHGPLYTTMYIYSTRSIWLFKNTLMSGLQHQLLLLRGGADPVLRRLLQHRGHQVGQHGHHYPGCLGRWRRGRVHRPQRLLLLRIQPAVPIHLAVCRICGRNQCTDL